MTNRERIILVVMALVIVYGAYSLFLESPRERPNPGVEKSTADIQKFVTDIAEGLGQESVERQLTILAQAKTDWAGDPFVDIRPSSKTETEEKVMSSQKTEEPEHTFRYTGFIEMGDSRIAIIDGLEYESGDELKEGGLVVKTIDPKRVLIGTENKDKNRVLILEETQ